MKGKAIGRAVVAAALFLISSACAVPEGAGYARVESYFYYPDEEVYFYPAAREYFWIEGGEWRHGPRAPARFVLKDREKVRLDMDHPPHTEHARIKQVYRPRKEVLKENIRERG
ncbi:MAG TPA: hypothetical protein VGA73_01735 [Candidatus Binatia bacterium]